MIVWNKVTGDNTLGNGGMVGDLMTIGKAHIDLMVEENRITQEEAGAVYSAMITQAMQQGVNFELQKEQINLTRIPQGKN